MSRTSRLFDLLQALRRRRAPVSGAELAREAGVSLRTVYRDIAALQALGAEIEGEAGVGYVLKPGFMLPPLMLSQDEIEALALGAKWVSRRTDPVLAAAAREAMAKIGAVLPADVQQRLDDSALLVGPTCRICHSVDLALLRRAVREERKLRINYCDERGRSSARTIWPIALSFVDSVRIVVAWCELRQDFRHFRTDRINAAELLVDRYPRRRQSLLKAWQRPMLSETGSERGYTPRQPSKRKEVTVVADIVFYTNPWSRGGIVHWMLEELGVPYTMETLEYGTTMKAPAYLEINPMGKVPAISMVR
jgi:predicted DNA-binding transcriptional regulator YafY